jgi:hypothetical protein
MTHHYDTPGVYIEEITGPGAIAGVGTGTAAFIGPALRGPMNEARRITSFEEFLQLYAIREPDGVMFWPYIPAPPQFYMAHAVRGFFENGGRRAHIVRVGTGAQASLDLQNRDGQVVFRVRAQEEGVAGNAMQVETQQHAVQPLAGASAMVTAVAAATVTVNSTAPFRAGDSVTTDGANRARITQIQGNNVVMDAALAGAAVNDTLRIADILPGQMSFRLASTAGLAAGGAALISGDDANAPGATRTERVVVQSVAPNTGVVTLHGARITNIAGATVTVDAGSQFRVADRVTTDGVNQARVNQVQGNDLTLDAALAGAAVNDILRRADTPPPRAITYNMAAAALPTLTSVRVVARGRSNISAVAGTTLTVDSPDQFSPGDIVTVDGVSRAEITRIQSGDVVLDQALAGAAAGATLRIADLVPAQHSFRVADTSGLYPGTVVLLRGDDAAAPGTLVEEYAVLQGAHADGFVTLEADPPRASTYNMNVALGGEPVLIPQEFRLIVTPAPAAGSEQPERFENLSFNPYHPRYILNTGVVTSTRFSIAAPPAPPTTAAYPNQLAALAGPNPLTNGADDQPSGLTRDHYRAGLNVLRDVDDVNMVCIPDAAAHPEALTIQGDMIVHCLAMGERFAILDSQRGAPPSGPGSVEEHRQSVQSDRGFAALYYPWLEAPEPIRPPQPRPAVPRRLLIPPSGHLAGIYARTDNERGVHKAPANTDVRGVLGLERRLSDGQQGPLNLAGINVLRIFPGSRQVTVWGARTTVDPIIRDWVYVPIRRLMLYIEESIQEGIRWAVFEPNNQALWKKLDRTISEFLTRIWRDGGLFGDKPEKAFYVRIDEALNPPAKRALGRLYIEIGVCPAYPAEFIIVRIGLWDGGAEITET